MKNQSRYITRRVKWFKEHAEKNEEIAWLKDRIDENFDDEELGGVYAVTTDMLLMSYPFSPAGSKEDCYEVLQERYSISKFDFEFLLDINEEMIERYPDKFKKL